VKEVKLEMFSPMLMKIVTEDEEYMELMREEFTEYVSGFRFMSAYKSGGWNGKVGMIDKFKHTIPYGLLTEFIRIHRKNFKRNKLTISDEVKNIFKGPKLKMKYDLELYPRPYQKDCIEASLKFTKGIIRSATASGKGLIIVYILKHLLENYKKTGVKNVIIVVPSVSLIKQFHDDLIDYGCSDDLIGEVWTKKKEWDKTIVISTWQSLSRNQDRLNDFQCVMVDECHGSGAFQLKKLLSHAVGLKYRLGFTGTMHSGKLDNWNVMSYLGPVIKDYPSGFLADQGWISKCMVNIFNIEYNGTDDIDGTYSEVKDIIFTNPYRMDFIGELVKKLDHNVLLLVGLVEKEGEVIKEYLETTLKGKEVIFLSGRDNVDIRERWRKECEIRKDIVLIATYGIFSQGINIPSLKYVVLASPFQSKIRVLQSIGRALRKHSDKEKGAIIFDIHDHVKYLDRHGMKRLRFYDSEKFEVNEHLFKEGDEITLYF